jgi:AbrB family looped-hinge helix DNA binding protein
MVRSDSGLFQGRSRTSAFDLEKETILTKIQVAEELLVRSSGATMDEIVAATGGPQYNLLRKLEGCGYKIRKIKEGRSTRYFAEPPAAPSFEATVTSKGQITLPKEIRERLGVRAGGKLRFTLESDERVVMRPVNLSIQRLFGILGKPPRKIPLEEIDEVIERALVEKYR